MKNVLEKILEEIEEATYQEDAPIYLGDMEVDGYVRESKVKEIIRSHMADVPDTDNGWIPYTEQNIPKKEGIYLVTCDDKEYPVKRMRFKENLWYWYYGIYDGRILAWQPLPEPYIATDKPDWKENMLNTFLAGH